MRRANPLLVVLAVTLLSSQISKAEFCFVDSDCDFWRSPFCCRNNQCCGEKYNIDIDDVVKTGGKIAIGVIIAIVVVVVILIIACIVGWVIYRKNTSRRSSVNQHAMQPQPGYYPEQASYPTGPAPVYVPPEQPPVPGYPTFMPQGPTPVPVGSAPYPTSDFPSKP